MLLPILRDNFAPTYSSWSVYFINQDGKFMAQLMLNKIGKLNLYLSCFGVYEPYRKLRLGSKLLNYVTSQYRNYEITLHASAYDPIKGLSQPELEAFYERYGFVKDEKLKLSERTPGYIRRKS